MRIIAAYPLHASFNLILRTPKANHHSRPRDACCYLASIHFLDAYRCHRPDGRAAMVSSLIFPHGFDRPAICSTSGKQSNFILDEGLGCSDASLAVHLTTRRTTDSQIIIYEQASKHISRIIFCHIRNLSFRRIAGSAARIAVPTVVSSSLSVAAVCGHGSFLTSTHECSNL
jgi:hypothetical protein